MRYVHLLLAPTRMNTHDVNLFVCNPDIQNNLLDRRHCEIYNKNNTIPKSVDMMATKIEHFLVSIVCGCRAWNREFRCGCRTHTDFFKRSHFPQPNVAIGPPHLRMRISMRLACSKISNQKNVMWLPHPEVGISMRLSHSETNLFPIWLPNSNQ